MLNSTDRIANEKAEREDAAKAARRAEEASIVSGLRAVLQPDEQLMGFARGRIAGGVKGRLSIGLEAFIAPFVNIGLTERRFIIQHLHGETARPSEILPHFFAVADIQTISFSDIETFGGAPACRLVLHLANGQSFRIRLTGDNNFASARALADVFRSLTSVRKNAAGPTQSICSSCSHILDGPTKFCPYCGAGQTPAADKTDSQPQAESVTTPPANVEKVTVVVTETQSDLLDDALEFLRRDSELAPQSEPPAEAVEPVEPAAKSDTGAATEDKRASEGDSGLVNADMPAAEADPGASPVASVEVSPSEPTSVSDEGMIDFSGSAQNSASLAPEEPVGSGAAQAAIPADYASEAPVSFEQASESEAIEAPVSFEPVPYDEPVYQSTPYDSPPDAESVETSVAFDQPQASEASEAHASESHTDTQSSEGPDPPAAENEPTAESTEATSASSASSTTTAFTASSFTYSEAASSAVPEDKREETPSMPSNSAASSQALRVHFHIKHPAITFDATISGRDADEVVSRLKDRVVAELKFPIKLAAMRLTPLEFAQEIVMRYNQEERQTLPRPKSCREFLHLVEAIGYATVETV